MVKQCIPARNHYRRSVFFRIRSVLILAVLFVLNAGLPAYSQTSSGNDRARSMHPTFPLLDSDGQNVLSSGKPLSTLKTCGGCHDTAYITETSIHRSTRPGGSILTRLGPWKQPIQGSELNCLVCHVDSPNVEAIARALSTGASEWAGTAALEGTSIVHREGSTWHWIRDAFDEDGSVKPEVLRIQDPRTENCGACHSMGRYGLDRSDTAHDPLAKIGKLSKTGQVFSPLRISDSPINAAGKNRLSRSWDVHAERMVACVDCHYSMNNPVYFLESAETRPDHLAFDPRRQDLAEYLHRPSHDLARGSTGDEPGTMRECSSCHTTDQGHDWLPNRDRHLDRLSCESCHVPHVYAPAVSAVDWTILKTNGEPRIEYRGVKSSPSDPASLVTGYIPILLPRTDLAGNTRLFPHNLVTSWYWVSGPANTPVSYDTLRVALLSGTELHPEVRTILDSDRNGRLSPQEWVLDTPDKVRVVRSRLQTLGISNPAIRSEIQPYTLHHSVAHGDWATRACHACHGENSRIGAALRLASQTPVSPLPELDVDDREDRPGSTTRGKKGQLFYLPAKRDLYIPGYNRIAWVDRLGLIAVLAVLAGSILHGGFRWFSRRRSGHVPLVRRTQPVYMYGFYERFWHWLQAASVTGLIATGLVIHFPDVFAWLSYRFVVSVHQVLGFILLVNALLSAFYHFASGEIRQYLPEPRGFFNQAVVQMLFYVRGMFQNGSHPFRKDPTNKLNPLQQITYLMILNVLLPLQVVTGILIWGAGRWPDLSNALSGLSILAPLHSLLSWLFAAFLILHMYLTTTGPTVTANVKAMITGWEELEEDAHGNAVHPAARPSEPLPHNVASS